MRIVHADTDDLDNPLRGGQPVRTFAINSRLAAHHDITVLTATYRRSKRAVVRAGIHYRRLGVTLPRWGLSSHLSYLARLPAAIRRTPHDLVVEEFTPPFGFCGLERHTARPTLSVVQWFFFDQWTRRYRLPFEDIMRRRALRVPVRHLIVQTDRMGSYFRDLLPGAQIHKVPCGLDRAAFQPIATSGDVALFLGRLDIAQKGIDDLLSAWARLDAQGLAIPLWIVGAGRDEAALKSRVESLGLARHVVFKGRLEGDAKRVALQRCRFLVMPSREETFGITALEAMASGKPVIAYAIEHLDELLKPGWSTLVRKGDTEALAAAVRAHWESPALCLAQGERGLAEARAYDWDVLAARQDDIYRHLTITTSFP